MLRTGLTSADFDERRRALRRWLTFAIAWQAAVVLLIVLYAVPLHSHPPDAYWAAPPLAAVVGTAVPLQVALVRIMRSLRF